MGQSQVTIKADPNLFKGLYFYFEILLNGKDGSTSFIEMVVNHGGKVLRALNNKKITHLVWSRGHLKTLRKACDKERDNMQIEIVSPLWVKACLLESKLVKYDEYRPANLSEMLKEASQKEVKAITDAINHKTRRRPDDSQQLKLTEFSGSKRKISTKPSSRKKDN